MTKKSKPRHVYLSGPMTGLPDYNFPAFHEAGEKLRALGYKVSCPTVNKPPCKTWEGYMRLAIIQMLACDAVAMLPGWQASRGAKIEMDLAVVLGMHVSTVAAMLGEDSDGW